MFNPNETKSAADLQADISLIGGDESIDFLNKEDTVDNDIIHAKE